MTRNKKLGRGKNIQQLPPVKVSYKKPYKKIKKRIVKAKKKVIIKHKLWHKNDKRQEYVSYAYQKGGLDFVALIEAESGTWKINQRSYIKGKNGYYDYGFCQINKGYHPKIVNDKRFFTDWRWQIDQCAKLYKGGTKFYGKRNISKVINRFGTM